MNPLETTINNYLFYCKTQKRLDEKTLKAYRIDLGQFNDYSTRTDVNEITIDDLESFIAHLHNSFKPKTAKRKIASLKAFFHYLEYKDIITINPFNKIHIKFREPVTLPKVIPLPSLELFLKTIYKEHKYAKTVYQKNKTLKDITIIELLFSTGIRISELCQLRKDDVNLIDNTILIYGKGSKERRIQIGNDDVISILFDYQKCFYQQICSSGYFFPSKSGEPLSDQYVRKMINKYSSIAGINMHITPHMFRHTFATSLLEADVDIRYIQEMLGHSSINITEIYTHVATAKQKDILRNKHPRKDFVV